MGANFIDYNECYLRALKMMADYELALDKPNQNHWVYKELKTAVEYYKKMASVK